MRLESNWKSFYSFDDAEPSDAFKGQEDGRSYRHSWPTAESSVPRVTFHLSSQPTEKIMPLYLQERIIWSSPELNKDILSLTFEGGRWTTKSSPRHRGAHRDLVSPFTATSDLLVFSDRTGNHSTDFSRPLMVRWSRLLSACTASDHCLLHVPPLKIGKRCSEVLSTVRRRLRWSIFENIYCLFRSWVLTIFTWKFSIPIKETE